MSNNDSTELMSMLLMEAFYPNSIDPTNKEACDDLARGILKGAIGCRIQEYAPYPGPGGEDALQAVIRKEPTIRRSSSESETDNLPLKAFAFIWLGKHMKEHGNFKFEQSAVKGRASDLISGNSNVWVECGAHDPSVVLDALDSPERIFLHFEKPRSLVMPNRSAERTVRIWRFVQGKCFETFKRTRAGDRSRLQLESRGPLRKPKLPPIKCENPNCQREYKPRTYNSRVCNRAECKQWQKANPKPRSPMPVDLREKILNMAQTGGNLQFYAFLCLTIDTGIKKGSLLDIRFADVIHNGNVVETLELRASKDRRSCLRNLKRRCRDSIRQLFETACKENAFTENDRLLPFKNASEPNIKLKYYLDKVGLPKTAFCPQDITSGTIAREIWQADNRGMTNDQKRELLKSFGLSGQSTEVDKRIDFAKRYREELKINTPLKS